MEKKSPLTIFTNRFISYLVASGNLPKQDQELSKLWFEASIERQIQQQSGDLESAIRNGIKQYCRTARIQYDVLFPPYENASPLEDYIATLVQVMSAQKNSNEIEEFGTKIIVSLRDGMEACCEEHGLELPAESEYRAFRKAVMAACQPIVNNKNGYFDAAAMENALADAVRSELADFLLRTNPQYFSDNADVHTFLNGDDAQSYFLGSKGNGLEEPIGLLADKIFEIHNGPNNHAGIEDPLKSNLQKKLFHALFSWYALSVTNAENEKELLRTASNQADAIATYLADTLSIYDSDATGKLKAKSIDLLQDELIAIHKQGKLGEIATTPAERERLVAHLQEAVQDIYKAFHADMTDTWGQRTQRNNWELGL